METGASGVNGQDVHRFKILKKIQLWILLIL